MEKIYGKGRFSRPPLPFEEGKATSYKPLKEGLARLTIHSLGIDCKSHKSYEIF